MHGSWRLISIIVGIFASLVIMFVCVFIWKFSLVKKGTSYLIIRIDGIGNNIWIFLITFVAVELSTADAFVTWTR